MFNVAIGWILFQLKNHSFHLDNKELCIQYGGLPRWLSGKESACNARDPGSIPGSGRFPAGNESPLWSSCPRNPLTEEPGEGDSLEVPKGQIPLSTSDIEATNHMCTWNFIEDLKYG